MMHDPGCNCDDCLDPRPCLGKNPNVCVAEGCYNEACCEAGFTGIKEKMRQAYNAGFSAGNTFDIGCTPELFGDFEEWYKARH